MRGIYIAAIVFAVLGCVLQGYGYYKNRQLYMSQYTNPETCTSYNDKATGKCGFWMAKGSWWLPDGCRVGTLTLQDTVCFPDLDISARYKTVLGGLSIGVGALLALIGYFTSKK